VTGTILTADIGSVRVLTIDNPAKKNALTPAMLRSLPELLQQAGSSTHIRAIVVTGTAGSGFCSGFDLGELRAGADPAEVEATLRAALDAIGSCELPVIAGIDGWCVGAGLELALTCDLRACSASSTFRMPAAELAITYPDRGLARFVAAMGRADAVRMVLLGERLDAATAQAMGVVHVVVDDPGQTVLEWGERIAGFDRAALASMKRSLRVV
jgi:enoyl-CoA hydratase/carnithine racemase